MPDMLVHLLKIADPAPLIDEMRKSAIVIRRAQPFEITPVREFITRHFAPTWADEVSVGFANKPVSIYLAIRDGAIVGFAACECTRRAFFGPMGVLEDQRGRGIGRALLLACLAGLRDMGYAYGIIGGVGPADFYTRTCGATLIPDSTPGIYTDGLK
ncbi:MAG TPA: GNAT family N-acetyltransferase [Tepidisphaeraceae bacterium]|jgi:predicted N-acetyltransferase YhbS